ncbi:UNVERIFIED_CONTAM: hypothetical protein FKN15_038147 [Acipenser sinensis]
MVPHLWGVWAPHRYVPLRRTPLREAFFQGEVQSCEEWLPLKPLQLPKMELDTVLTCLDDQEVEGEERPCLEVSKRGSAIPKAREGEAACPKGKEEGVACPSARKGGAAVLRDRKGGAAILRTEGGVAVAVSRATEGGATIATAGIPHTPANYMARGPLGQLPLYSRGLKLVFHLHRVGALCGQLLPPSGGGTIAGGPLVRLPQHSQDVIENTCLTASVVISHGPVLHTTSGSRHCWLCRSPRLPLVYALEVVTWEAGKPAPSWILTCGGSAAASFQPQDQTRALE